LVNRGSFANSSASGHYLLQAVLGEMVAHKVFILQEAVVVAEDAFTPTLQFHPIQATGGAQGLGALLPNF